MEGTVVLLQSFFLRHEKQFRKFFPFIAPGFPLIAGDVGSPEQLLVDLTL